LLFKFNEKALNRDAKGVFKLGEFSLGVLLVGKKRAQMNPAFIAHM
jgi:hypothetical protein